MAKDIVRAPFIIFFCSTRQKYGDIDKTKFRWGKGDDWYGLLAKFTFMHNTWHLTHIIPVDIIQLYFSDLLLMLVSYSAVLVNKVTSQNISISIHKYCNKIWCLRNVIIFFSIELFYFSCQCSWAEIYPFSSKMRYSH